MANLLTEGTYEKLTIIGTRLETHKPGEPKVVITLAEPGADGSDGGEVTDFPKISDYLYTSNDAWDKVTKKRLAAYGWDAEANSYDLSYFNAENPLIGTTVGPVVLKDDPYVKDGVTKSSIKVYRVGDEKFGSQLGGPEAQAETAAFQQRMRMRLAGAGQKLADSLPGYAASASPKGAQAPTDDVPF